MIDFGRRSFQDLLHLLFDALFLLVEPVEIVLENISKCCEAMQLDVQLSDHLIESEFFTKNPHVISLEDSLLDLVSSTAVDGIFYCCSVKVSLGDKSLHVALHH